MLSSDTTGMPSVGRDCNAMPTSLPFTSVLTPRRSTPASRRGWGGRRLRWGPRRPPWSGA
jgi:hypothetical protein